MVEKDKKKCLMHLHNGDITVAREMTNYRERYSKRGSDSRLNFMIHKD
jgi:hypothetical protein